MTRTKIFHNGTKSLIEKKYMKLHFNEERIFFHSWSAQVREMKSQRQSRLDQFWRVLLRQKNYLKRRLEHGCSKAFRTWILKGWLSKRIIRLRFQRESSSSLNVAPGPQYRSPWSHRILEVIALLNRAIIPTFHKHPTRASELILQLFFSFPSFGMNNRLVRRKKMPSCSELESCSVRG